ncbi:MAG: discoidin domain-containing protein [Victivallales bacterium]|nr:discoidin domain-containing protein [Victivallales bacterium]
MKRLFAFLLLCGLSLVAAVEWKTMRGKIAYEPEFGLFTGMGTLVAEFEVKPKTDYFFSAQLCSSANVLFTINYPGSPVRKYIGYDTIGKRRKIAGAFRTREATVLRVELTVSPGPDGGSGAFTILKDEKLQEVTPEMMRSAPSALEKATTRLAGGVMVVPASLENPLGERLRALSDTLRLEFRTDAEVCLADVPVLKPEFATRNLVVVGNLNSNRAFWPAYTRRLAASDHFYPGGDGYELRTAVNVLGNGCNHIIVGASSTAGLQTAVERLAALATDELPYLLEVKLGGDCLKSVEEDQEVWRNYPDGAREQGDVPGTSPGYDMVRCWFHQALMYYWTGLPLYRELNARFTETVLEQNAFLHHYVMEWMFATWRITRSCGLFSEEQRTRMEKMLAEKYIEFQSGPDYVWFKPLQPPYDVRITSRHVTSPMFCQLMASDYLARYNDLSPELREVAEYGCRETLNAVKSVARNSSRPYGDYEGGDDYTELSQCIFRYAFQFDDYDLFRGRHPQAQLWGQTELFTNSSLRNTVLFRSHPRFHIQMGVLACFYRDPLYQYYWTKLKSTNWTGMFNDRYPCGIGTFHSDVEPRNTWRDARLSVLDYTPMEKRLSQGLPGLLKKYPQYAPRTPVNLAVLRGGYAEDYPVLAIAGSSERAAVFPGEVTELALGGESPLAAWWTAVYSNNSGLPFERNSLYVNRENQGDNAVNDRPACGFESWRMNLAGIQAVSLEFPGYNGITWHRTALMLDSRTFLIGDSMTAEVADSYDLACVWRPFGNILPATSDTLAVQNKSGKFTIQATGRGFALETNTADYLARKTPFLSSRYGFHGRLAEGETATVYALLQLNGSKRLHDCGDGRLLVSENGQAVMEILWDNKGFQLISSKGIYTTPRTQVAIGEETVAVADQPSSMVWYFETGNCYRQQAGYRKAEAEENRAVQERCLHYLASLAVPAEKAEAASADKDNLTVQEDGWRQEFSAPPMVATDAISLTWVPNTRFDLKKTISLCAMRNRVDGRELPREIEYSEDGENWRKLSLTPHWLPGEKVGNYGNTTPLEHGYSEAVIEPPVQARYVRTAEKCALVFFDGSVRRPRRPVKLLCTDPFILASWEVLKAWPRRYLLEDNLFQVISLKGEVLFQQASNGGIHELRKLDFPQKDSIAVARSDSMLDFYSPTGQELLHIDSYRQMRDFDRKHGKPNTRQPSGGFSATYSLGVWKGRLVAGRYGMSSYYEKTGRLLGIHRSGIYSIGHALENGVDFGQGEMLPCQGTCYMVFHRDDGQNGEYPEAIYPEIFGVTRQSLPLWWNISNGVWGTKVFEFKALPFNGQNYLVGATRNYLYVMDVRTHKYLWSRKAVAPYADATIAAVGDGAWLAMVAGDDGTLTMLRWADPGQPPSTVAKIVLSADVRDMHITPQGRAYLATTRGILELVGNRLLCRIPGDFTDVKSLKDGRLATADGEGRVTVWTK